MIAHGELGMGGSMPVMQLALLPVHFRSRVMKRAEGVKLGGSREQGFASGLRSAGGSSIRCLRTVLYRCVPDKEKLPQRLLRRLGDGESTVLGARRLFYECNFNSPTRVLESGLMKLEESQSHGATIR